MEETPSYNQMYIFNQFYSRYYSTFAWRCTKAVKDDVVASGMVHDAFLNVWHLRDQLPADDIYEFLNQQLKKAIYNYYRVAKNRFHVNLFRLDDLAHPDFLLIADAEIVEEDQPIEMQKCLLVKYHEQWLQVKQLIPHLSETQQQLIKLCLKYDFSYDRIAYYLGGISDYVVAKQVEDLLKNLKHILTNEQKLQDATQKAGLTFTGAMDDLQKNVMMMRYELQYSFEEIARELNLAEAQVKLAYVKAYQMCK
jgi:RNA polymerase sigma factor (sigma-70 family)